MFNTRNLYLLVEDDEKEKEEEGGVGAVEKGVGGGGKKQNFNIKFLNICVYTHTSEEKGGRGRDDDSFS